MQVADLTADTVQSLAINHANGLVTLFLPLLNQPLPENAVTLNMTKYITVPSNRSDATGKIVTEMVTWEASAVFGELEELKCPIIRTCLTWIMSMSIYMYRHSGYECMLLIYDASSMHGSYVQYRTQCRIGNSWTRAHAAKCSNPGSVCRRFTKSLQTPHEESTDTSQRVRRHFMKSLQNC